MPDAVAARSWITRPTPQVQPGRARLIKFAELSAGAETATARW